MKINNKQWIADVGFGGNTASELIPLDINKPIEMRDQTLRIIESQEFGFMLQALVGENWKNLYSFDLGYVCQGDIDYANHYTSTHPDSIFVTNRIAVRPVRNGLRMLFNSTFKVVEDGKESSKDVSGGQEYLDLLKREFDIQLDVPPDTLKISRR